MPLHVPANEAGLHLLQHHHSKHGFSSRIQTFAFIPVTTCFDLARKTKPTCWAVFRIAQPHLINSARVTYVMFCSAQLLPHQRQVLLFFASSSAAPALFSLSCPSSSFLDSWTSDSTDRVRSCVMGYLSGLLVFARLINRAEWMPQTN